MFTLVSMVTVMYYVCFLNSQIKREIHHNLKHLQIAGFVWRKTFYLKISQEKCMVYVFFHLWLLDVFKDKVILLTNWHFTLEVDMLWAVLTLASLIQAISISLHFFAWSSDLFIYVFNNSVSSNAFIYFDFYQSIIFLNPKILICFLDNLLLVYHMKYHNVILIALPQSIIVCNTIKNENIHLVTKLLQS